MYSWHLSKGSVAKISSGWLPVSILLLLFQEWHPGSLLTYGDAQHMQAENL